MNTYVKSKVVILPTKDGSKITIRKSDSKLLFNQDYFNTDLGDNQHLYFLSDGEIKNGDWIVTQKTTDKEDGYEVVQIKSIHFIKEGDEYITAFGFDTGLKTNIKKVVKCKYFSNYHKHDVLINTEECKKIIATTDRLLIKYNHGGTEIVDCDCNDYVPRPSNEFLRKYCELGGIDEALVEYEYNHDDTVPYPKTVEGETYKLKVSPDNTITIKPIKDSWNREEVVKLIKEFHNCICDHPARNVNNWIKENL